MLQSIQAQLLLENSKQTIRLKDGIELNCYKAYSMTTIDSDAYYYLPTNINFPITKSGDKSYSLLVYKDENEKIKGAIMHWLVSWGLSKSQKNEAQLLLKSKAGSNAKLMGVVLAEKNKDDFEIQGKNKLSEILNKALASKGNVPLTPNSKIAVAYKFTKEDALKIDELFHNRKEQNETYIIMRFLVSFKKSNGSIYKKTIIIKQNLQTLIL